MADHIPFVTGEDAAALVEQYYSDSDVVRVPLIRAATILPLLSRAAKVWIDPCCDGMHDIESRREVKRGSGTGKEQTSPNPWFTFMSRFSNFESVGTPEYHAKPLPSEVCDFVAALMDECASFKPSWITVPQFPLVNDGTRNKINRALATATGRWKRSGGFAGRLILPLVLTHQEQMNGKTARTPRVQQAERCYEEAQADGFWVVDSSLEDEGGSKTLVRPRFPGIINFHEELNERIPSRIRIGGPYWGLNLVLWARGIVDFAAIGVGLGYQYSLAGGQSRLPTTRLPLPPLRRRAVAGQQLREWLEKATKKLAPSHPAYSDFSELSKHFALLQSDGPARKRVARFYKQWYEAIATVPKAGRAMALFQDLATAYALGKSLSELPEKGTARRPEAVAEPLMLSCL